MKKVAVVFKVEKAGFSIGEERSFGEKLAGELVSKGFAEYADEKPKKGSGKKAAAKVVETKKVKD